MALKRNDIHPDTADGSQIPHPPAADSANEGAAGMFLRVPLQNA